MSKISAFLFDMDGTLIDTECYYRRCWPAALKEFGYTMTDEQALLMRSLGRPYAPKLLQEWKLPRFQSLWVEVILSAFLLQYAQKEALSSPRQL